MKHSSIGASSCKRWWNCSGSVALIASLPEQKHSSSKYAIEGTVAHGIGEVCLKENKDPYDFVDEVIEEQDVDITVTNNMAEAVQLYLDTIDADLAKHNLTRSALKVEKGFVLTDVDKEAFGTNDCSLEIPFKKLYVYDYKHGAGIPVNVNRNKQLMFYALGAVMGTDFSEVELVIIQPRANHSDGFVRRCAISKKELDEFRAELIKRIAETRKPNAKLASGSWCRFCPASAVCTELKKKAEKSLITDFQGIPVPVNQVSLADMVKAFSQKDIIINWFNQIEGHILGLLEKGKSVKGYKLVKRRANRKWVDEAQVIKVFEKSMQDELFSKPKLKSPAQLEKILGKKTVAEFIFKPEAGVTIALSADKRPEVIVGSIEQDFQNV